MPTATKVAARKRRHGRVRKKVYGTPERPRLAVFRSNRHVYAQLIDDISGVTLAASSTLSAGGKGDRVSQAKAVGEDIAKQAKASGIGSVTFDRGGFMFHGRVKAVADGAREGGLGF